MSQRTPIMFRDGVILSADHPARWRQGVRLRLCKSGNQEVGHLCSRSSSALRWRYETSLYIQHFIHSAALIDFTLMCVFLFFFFFWFHQVNWRTCIIIHTAMTPMWSTRTPPVCSQRSETTSTMSAECLSRCCTPSNPTDARLPCHVHRTHSCRQSHVVLWQHGEF